MAGAEVIELLFSWIVTTALVFAIVIFDERRMSEERLERAWPVASRNAAIVAFGILSLPVHFARTRGGFRSVRDVLGIFLGLLMGVAAVVAVAVASGLLLEGLALVLGLPDR